MNNISFLGDLYQCMYNRCGAGVVQFDSGGMVRLGNRGDGVSGLGDCSEEFRYSRVILADC